MQFIVCQLKPLKGHYDEISPDLRMGKMPVEPPSPRYDRSQNVSCKWPPILSVHKVTFNILPADLF